MKRRLPIFFLLVALSARFEAGARGDNWPQWRGPHGTGVADGAGYPIEWSPSKNVLWKLALPAPGSSTPAIWGERLFLTMSGETNVVLCVSRDGGELWRRELNRAREGKHRKATGANSSPVADAERVYAYFKSGDLAAFDHQGEPLWQHNLQQEFGEDTLWWDLGTSPALTRRDVVVACMQSERSYVAAFDKVSGKLAWKVDRNLGAPEENEHSYTTPMIVDQEDGSQLIVILGADHVTAHRAEDGAEVWRVGGLNVSGGNRLRSISSPVILDGIVVAPYERGKSLSGIALGGAGDVTASHVRWTIVAGADVPTPAAQGGRVYVCGDRGPLQCLDLKTGELVWELPLPRGRGNFSASPILAEGRLYLTREDGATLVVQLGETPKLLATNTVDEWTVATPVFVDGRIYLRTLETLYCVGGK